MGGLLPTKNQHHTPKVDNKLPTLLAVARQMEADSSMNAIAKNKTAPRPLLPRLRFAEFRDAGEWEAQTLKEISEPVEERVGDRSLTPISISAGIGFVPQAEKFGRDISGNQYKLYTVIRDGDFVYNKGNSLKFPQGCVYDLQGWGEAAAPNVFICFRLKTGYENAFYRQCFERNLHGIQLRKQITSGARSNGLLNISKEVFYGISIPTPQLEEQQKIAACLSSLDTLITAEAQKLDTLKTHKKGLMQQLFPRAGETTPRLRFAEFQEAGEWETSFGDAIFSQISNKKHNSDLPVLAITQEHGAIPRDMIDYHVSVTDKSIESYKVVEVGDFIISLRSFQGGIEFSKYRGICSPAYVILRLTEAHSQDYFRHYLKTERFIAQMTKNLEGLRDGKMISFKQFSELELPIPQPAEQQKIAACLSSLDELITAQAQKVTALQTHKKGLMQQLFPAQAKASA